MNHTMFLLLLALVLPGTSLHAQEASNEIFDKEFFPPVGWTATDKWSTSINAYVGEYAALCGFMDAHDETLTSARMDLTQGIDEFSFHWRSNATPDNDACSVIVAVSYDAGDNWMPLDTLYGTEGTWTEETYTFDNQSTDHAYIKWNYQGTGVYSDGARSFVLDNVFYPRWYPDAPMMVAYPGDQLDFDTINIMESNTRSFMVYNYGLQTLTIDETSFAGMNPDAFELVNELPIQLENLEEEEVTIAFSPIHAGDQSAAASFSHNGTPSPFTIDLIGYGHDPVLHPPFLEVFDSFPPTDWFEARGEISEDTEFTAEDFSSWGSASFGNQEDGSSSARVTLALERYEWLITPPIYLYEDIDYELTFDLALTIRNTTDPGDLDESKSLWVVISEDNGETWSASNALKIYDEDSEISHEGQAESILISGYSGHVKLAFYGESLYHTGVMYDIFVDNVRVRADSEEDEDPPIAISLEGNSEVENVDMDLLLTVFDDSFVTDVTAHFTIEDSDTLSMPMTLVEETDPDKGRDDDNGDDDDEGAFYIFEGTIPAPEGPAEGTVYFTMTDVYGNTGDSNDYDLEWYADTEGPEITWHRFPTTLGLENPGVVAVELEDPSGIAAATLTYNITGHEEADASLVQGEDGLYQAEIPAQSSPADVVFHIRAVDGSVHENETVTDFMTASWIDPLVSELPIATESYSQSSPQVAFDGERYFVVFDDNRLSSSANAYWGRFVDPDGTVHVDTETEIVPYQFHPHYFPALAYGGDRYLLTYAQQRTPDDFNRDYVGILIDTEGQPVGEKFMISDNLPTNNVSFSSTAYDGEQFLTVWQQGEDTREVWGRFIKPGSGLSGEPFLIRPEEIPANANQRVPNVIHTGEHFMVTWDDGRAGNRDVYGQLLDSNGNLVGDDFAITSGPYMQGISRIAQAGDRILVAWEDLRDHSTRSGIYAQMIDTEGNLIGEDFHIARTEDSLSRSWVSLVSNGSEFLASWSHQRRDGIVLFHDVYAAHINMMGEVGEFIEVVAEERTQSNSRTATNGDDYIVVWEDGREGGYYDTYGHILEGSHEHAPPEVASLEGNEAITGHDMHLVLEVHSPGPLQSATGQYTIDGVTEELQMENIQKTHYMYEGTIPAFDVETSGSITFDLVDAHGNTHTSEAFPIEWSADTDPPVITLKDAPTWAYPNEEVQVTARVTDESGVASVMLYYTIDGEESNIQMEGQDDLYAASIPGQPENSQASYYVEATDASDNQNTGESEEVEIEWRDVEGEWYGNYQAENITGMGLQNDQPWSLGVAIDLGEQEGRLLKIAYILNEGTNPPIEWRVLDMEDDATWTETEVDAGGLLTDDPVIDGDGWTEVPVYTETVLSGNIGLVIDLKGGGYWGRDNNQPHGQSFMYFIDQWVKLGEDDLEEYPGDWTLKCYIELDDGSVTIIEPEMEALTLRNYPNPFSDHTHVAFTLEQAEHVQLTIHDMQGRQVTTLADEHLSAGDHSYRWDAGNLRDGVYFYRLTTSSGASYSGTMIKK